MNDKLICVGVITSSYQLKGLVKITTFTAQKENICKLPCFDIAGNKYICKFIREDKNKIICRIDGVEDRTAAEKLEGTKLYINRSDLPELSESEYYIEDLVGLEVRNIDTNEICGQVVGFHNFGADDIIEIKLSQSKKTEMYPFTNEIFPQISKESIFMK